VLIFQESERLFNRKSAIMPFTLDPAVGAALAKLMGPDVSQSSLLQTPYQRNQGPPPPIPAGDVQTRRKVLDALFATFTDFAPAVADVESKDFHTKAEDGHEMILRWCVN
jgi:hypothetical protein